MFSLTEEQMYPSSDYKDGDCEGGKALDTKVPKEWIWVKYGLLQIKQKPQSSPKQTFLETRYYLFDTCPH